MTLLPSDTYLSQYAPSIPEGGLTMLTGLYDIPNKPSCLALALATLAATVTVAPQSPRIRAGSTKKNSYLCLTQDANYSVNLSKQIWRPLAGFLAAHGG